MSAQYAAWIKSPSTPPEVEESESTRPTIPAPAPVHVPSASSGTCAAMSLEQLFEPMILRKRFARTVAK